MCTTVQAKNVDKTRRMFTGQEAISVVATNAIGHTMPVPITLEQRGLRAVAAFTPFTPGPLKLAVSIASDAVASSPLNLTVSPGKISSRHCATTPVTRDIAARMAQDLPKGALAIVHGGDALANFAALDPSDVDIAVSPPEAISDLQLTVLPDQTVAVCGTVEREADAVVSVLGTKVNQRALKLRPVTAETARLRVVHVPESAPAAGEQVAVMLQACDASGTVLDMADLRVQAELLLKAERSARPPLHHTCRLQCLQHASVQLRYLTGDVYHESVVQQLMPLRGDNASSAAVPMAKAVCNVTAHIIAPKTKFDRFSIRPPLTRPPCIQPSRRRSRTAGAHVAPRARRRSRQAATTPARMATPRIPPAGPPSSLAACPTRRRPPSAVLPPQTTRSAPQASRTSRTAACPSPWKAWGRACSR